MLILMDQEFDLNINCYQEMLGRVWKNISITQRKDAYKILSTINIKK